MDENAHPGSGGWFSCSQFDKPPEMFFGGFAPHCRRFTANSSGVKKEDKISGARLENAMLFCEPFYAPQVSKLKNLKRGGGSVAKWSERRTHNPASPG